MRFAYVQQKKNNTRFCEQFEKETLETLEIRRLKRQLQEIESSERQEKREKQEKHERYRREQQEREDSEIKALVEKSRQERVSNYRLFMTPTTPSRRAPTKYTKEFKRDAVNLVLERGYSRIDAATSLNLHESVLGRWLKEHRALENSAFKGHSGQPI